MSLESVEAAIAVLTGQPCKPKPRLCEICDAEKAVGKYYVDRNESENYGWWRVCSGCSEMVTRVGANVQYYKYSAEFKAALAQSNRLPEHVQNCQHDWDKWSNVGEHDKYHDAIFDWMKCTKCQIYGKRFGVGHTTIVDIQMSIDLNCSR
ncbi:hypothetical protein AB6D11_18505 [Vibrio splendidus]